MCSSSTGTREGHSTHFLTGRPDLHLPLDRPAEELQMAQAFDHTPVMRDEVVALYASVPPGVVVDATVGGAGHAAALLGAYPHLRLLGLDRDRSALEAAQARLSPYAERVTLVGAPFSKLETVLDESGVGDVSGALFDLGVSSPQLDVAERGFSFRRDGPLDMRMDPAGPVTAADLVNEMPEDELADLFRQNGEGRLARRIARAVVRARPLRTTGELADAVAGAVPAAVRRRGHPARRVFQALRIAVNDELGELAAALPVALDRLVVGGVCAVISYHSGEDRLTKAEFARAATGGCECPPGMPCVCGAVVRHQLVFRGSRRPSASEAEANPRSQSARLRAIVRVAPATATEGAGDEGTRGVR
jgi:16S rRNA (cytosine1402-N4)-methyltransferase